MYHNCEKNPEDCERIHGRQSSKPNIAIWGAILGAVAGIPLSYYFQPSILRVKITLSDYLRYLPDVLSSEYAGNFYAGVFVCGLIGAVLGFLVNRL